MPRSRTLTPTVIILLVLGTAWWYFRPETAFINRRVDEPAPDAPTTVLMSGSFTPREHQGRGLAQVLQLAGGQRVLRFADFETLDGPDLQVYLLGSPDASSRTALERGGFLSLGPLKGNIGAQNYAIPEDVQLPRYHGVAIWCRRFDVNFTTAVLAPSISRRRSSSMIISSGITRASTTR